MAHSATRVLALLVFVVSLTRVVEAQIRKAALSPRGVLEQDVGLVKLRVEYGRPGVKGRKVFGHLEPFGKVWRTGAGPCTKISFNGDVRLGEKDVPAGAYSLFTIPGKKTWTIILNRDTKLWGAGGYDPSKDVLRVDVPVIKLRDVCETLRIDVSGFHANGGDLMIEWADTRVSMPVFVDSDAQVFAEIERKLVEPTAEAGAQTYFDAAMFYYEKGRDLKTASEWMEQAIKRQPSAFWMVYYRAELLHSMGQKREAKTLAEKALALAKKARHDFGYIPKSEMLLAKMR